MRYFIFTIEVPLPENLDIPDLHTPEGEALLRGHLNLDFVLPEGVRKLGGKIITRVEERYE